MKKRSLLKKLMISLSVITIMFVSIAASSSKVGSGGGKKDPGGETPCSVVEKDAQIVLYNYANLPAPSIRKTNTAYTCPAMPHLGNGSFAAATSLYDSPNTKYYCLITVANLDCKNWGDNGVKTYVCNSPNMTIKVPGNMQFRISIEYYEPCGPYWTDNSWGRGKWYTEKTIGYQSIIDFTQWAFVKKENC